MLSNETFEEKIEGNEKKFRELSIRLEKLNQETANFLHELEVSSEQLTQFISTKENFSDESWEELQKQKAQLDMKLERELQNIRNPLKSKKALASLNIQSHWLHVR